MARILIKRGVTTVVVLHGGFDEWLERGFPTQPAGTEWRVETAGGAPGGMSTAAPAADASPEQSA